MNQFSHYTRQGLVLGALALVAISGAQSIRVATWNISAYTGGRTSDIQNVVYGSFQGRQMAPDVILAQEIQSKTAAAAFVSALNGASNSPGDWAYVSSPLTGTNTTSDSAMFYRTSKINALTPTLVHAADGSSGQPRDTYRFDAQIKGNSNTSEVLGMYDVHMKSGEGSDDVSRRQIEAQRIRDNANALGSNYQVLVAGDMNMQESSQAPYQTFTTAGTNARGEFFDPINSPGSWNNNAAFKFIHTQDPTGSGGMDDRHDQILLGSGMFDGTGTEYVGNRSLKYSTTSWDDPNHSYRAWGNDGTSFDHAMTTTGNTMVGESIAKSIAACATSAGGHIPVFLDIKYSPVPEPATFAIFGLGVVALARRRRSA